MDSGNVAEWVRELALSQSEWMVLKSNPSEGRNYFYSRVGDGGLSKTCFDGYIVAINKTGNTDPYGEFHPLTMGSQFQHPPKSHRSTIKYRIKASDATQKNKKKSNASSYPSEDRTKEQLC